MTESKISERRCCVCHVIKPISAFGPHKKNPSGYQYECRACVNDKVKRYVAEKGEEYKNKKRAYDKERFASKKDELSKKNKIRYEENRDFRIASSKTWAQANPDRVRATKQNYKHKRRAKEAAGITSSELRLWKDSQEKICFWCGGDCSHDPIVDHYMPLSKGGLQEVSNLVMACRSCNARKSNKLPEVFAQEISARLSQVARNTVTPEMLAA